MSRRASQVDASEYQEQAALFTWWNVYRRTVKLDERLLLAIPNGAYLAGDARRRAIQMARLKAAGLRPGAPDVFLAVPRGSWHGLFIEMKSSKGKASVEQNSYLGLLELQYYDIAVCHGATEAIALIKTYLKA